MGRACVLLQLLHALEVFLLLLEGKLLLLLLGRLFTGLVVVIIFGLTACSVALTLTRCAFDAGGLA